MRIVIYVTVALALVALTSCSVSAGPRMTDWEAYKHQFGKVYDEDQRRNGIYLATKSLVEEHNSKPSTFKMELNHLSDWSMDEFTAPLKDFGIRSSKNVAAPVQARRSKLSSSLVPAKFDWRKNQDSPRVGPVGDQGRCASAYAFAATGVLEGRQNKTDLGEIVQLSAQQIIDCSNSNDGCNGGLASIALDDLADDQGITTERMYPYIAKQRRHCGYASEMPSWTVYGEDDLYGIDEEALAKYVHNNGPVAIAFNAGEKLKSYKSGVYPPSECSQDEPNHSALIVGFGTDKEAGDFWIVKNSWSDKWGEDGYFRLTRGANACGLLADPAGAKSS